MGRPGPVTEVDWEQFKSIQLIHNYVSELTQWIEDGLPKRLVKEGVWDLVSVECDPRKHFQPKVMKIYVLHGLPTGKPVQDWINRIEQRFVLDTLKWSKGQFDGMIPKAGAAKVVASARQQARKGNGPAKAAGPAAAPSASGLAPAKKVAAAKAQRTQAANAVDKAVAAPSSPSGAVAKAKAQRAAKAGITPAAVTPPPAKASGGAVAKARAARAKRAQESK